MNPAKRIRVYFNSHKKAYSIQEKVGRSWKVVRHSPTVFLTDAVFHVSEPGRQRVLREKRKNVHAHITGCESGYLEDCLTEVSYSPYRGAHFVARKGNQISFARRVSLYTIENKPLILCLL